MWAGAPLRVSTPLHTYNQKQYNRMRMIDPTLYENIVEVFPDMAHADRYNTSKLAPLNKDFKEYPHTIQGLISYIDDCYKEPNEAIRAKKQVLWAYKKREQNKKRKGSDKFGGYPLYYLFRIIQKGRTMRNIIPCEKPSQKMYTYEGYTIQDYVHDKNNRGKYYANRTH